MGLSDLPLADGKKHVKALQRLGWSMRTRSPNNHFVLTHSDKPQVYISMPDHKEVKKQTLKAILRDAGISDKEYARAFVKKKGAAT